MHTITSFKYQANRNAERLNKRIDAIVPVSACDELGTINDDIFFAFSFIILYHVDLCNTYYATPQTQHHLDVFTQTSRTTFTGAYQVPRIQYSRKACHRYRYRYHGIEEFHLSFWFGSTNRHTTTTLHTANRYTHVAEVTVPFFPRHRNRNSLSRRMLDEEPANGLPVH